MEKTKSKTVEQAEMFWNIIGIIINLIFKILVFIFKASINIYRFLLLKDMPTMSNTHSYNTESNIQKEEQIALTSIEQTQSIPEEKETLELTTTNHNQESPENRFFFMPTFSDGDEEFENTTDIIDILEKLSRVKNNWTFKLTSQQLDVLFQWMVGLDITKNEDRLDFITAYPLWIRAVMSSCNQEAFLDGVKKVKLADINQWLSTINSRRQKDDEVVKRLWNLSFGCLRCCQKQHPTTKQVVGVAKPTWEKINQKILTIVTTYQELGLTIPSNLKLIP
jgi:hypothetical protein